MYLGSKLWNTIRNILKIFQDFSVNISLVKKQLKLYILKIQKIGDSVEWSEENFKI